MHPWPLMVRHRQSEIVDALRRRIYRALQVRALRPGDRLPSTRELSAELRANPRVVASAYRALAAEGLVELRTRSGVFVSSELQLVRARPEPSTHWLAELFAAGVERGIPTPELPRVLSSALGRRQLRLTVIATTADQTEGICHELRDDFGFESRGALAETILQRAALPASVRRAQMLVTTEAHELRVAGIAARLEVPFVRITVRPDLYESEWSLLRGQEAYVLVADPRFGEIVREYLGSAGAEPGVHILVAGKDSLSAIPSDAPLYATQAARARVGPTRLPVGLLPPVRVISDDCAREIIQKVLLLQH